jgi:YidC/Oxa1 family membrane protein insertase
MTYIVPLFALSGLYWAFGLVMYWVTTNIWTLGQQYVLFKRYPMPPVATDPAAGPGKAPAAGKSPAKAAPADKTPAAGGGGSARKQAGGAGKPANAAGGGQSSANGSGMLRRLTKGRPEPEPQDAVPETKLVRQQRTKQSRSKRSGKR